MSAHTWLLAVIVATVSFGGCGHGGQQSVTPHPALTVTAAAAEVVTWPSVVESTGAVAAWQEALIGARLSGLPLDEVLVNVGDHVRRGQTLAHFDDAPVRAEVAQMEASLAQATAGSREAEANRDRALRLRSTGALSEQSILQTVTQADSALAQVAGAKAALGAAQLKLQYTRVTAPDDGLISSRSATVGSVAQSGVELFKLIRRGRLEWRAELTPAQLAVVHSGLDATLTLPDGSTATGKVRELAPGLDAATRLGIAYVDLNPGGTARAGLYARGRIEIAASSALTVPAESVVIHDGRSYVARLDGERVQLVAVTTGRRTAERVEVLEHLAAGQTVAVSGAGFLNDGDLVSIAAEATAATPSRVAADPAAR